MNSIYKSPFTFIFRIPTSFRSLRLKSSFHSIVLRVVCLSRNIVPNIYIKYSFNDRIVNGQFHKYFSVGVDRFSQFNFWMRLIAWEFILTFHHYWKMHYSYFALVWNEECLIIRQTVTVNYNMCIVHCWCSFSRLFDSFSTFLIRLAWLHCFRILSTKKNDWMKCLIAIEYWKWKVAQ